MLTHRTIINHPLPNLLCCPDYLSTLNNLSLFIAFIISTSTNQDVYIFSFWSVNKDQGMLLSSVCWWRTCRDEGVHTFLDQYPISTSHQYLHKQTLSRHLCQKAEHWFPSWLPTSFTSWNWIESYSRCSFLFLLLACLLCYCCRTDSLLQNCHNFYQIILQSIYWAILS